MTLLKNQFLSLILILVFIPNASKALPLREFHSLSVNGEQCGRYINDFARDSYGFLWIATSEGLYRFDGYIMHRFQMTDNPQLGFIKVASDDFGTTWALSYKHLYYIDGRQERLGKATSESLTTIGVKDGINGMAVDNARNLWMWSGKTLYRCATKSQRAWSVSLANNIVALSGNSTTAWTLTDKGQIVKINLYSRTVVSVVKAAIKGNDSDIFFDSKSRLWVYDKYGTTLQCFDTKNGMKLLQVPNILQNRSVKDIVEDDMGNVWFATNNDGIAIFNANGDMETFVHDDGNAMSLQSNHINTIYNDAYGTMWIGTMKSGVAYSTLSEPLLNIVKMPIQEDVASFIETPSGNLWIGFDGKGLMKCNGCDMQTGNILDTRNSQLSSDLVVGMYQVRNSPIWIGTYGGGLMYANDNGTIQPFRAEGDISHARFIRMDSSNRLYVGTFNKGLFVFNIDQNGHGRLLKHYEVGTSPLKSNTITGLYINESGGGLVVSASTGVYVVDLKSFEIKLKIDINADCMCVDKDGKIWVGTRSGIKIFDKQWRCIDELTTDAGLSDNHVITIVIDKNGNIWASTDRGLTNIVENKSSERQNRYRCSPFYVNNGYKDIAFNRHSAICLSNGHVLFGAMGCVADVNTEALVVKENKTKVLITGLSIDGKPIFVGDTVRDVVAFRERLYLCKSISVPAQCNVELELSNPSDILNDGIHFVYSLDGEPWTLCKDYTVMLGQLTVGSHTLKVCRVGDTDVPMLITEIEISVGHWWQSLWAKILASVLIVLMVMATISLYIKRKKRIYEGRLQEIMARLELERKLDATDHETEITNVDENFIAKAKVVIEKHISDSDFSVDDFSTEMGMSRSSLYKKIKALTNLSPLEFMRMIRMQYGMKLLEKSGMSISQVAYSIGLSPKQFAKFFKDRYGMLPSTYIHDKEEQHLSEKL